MASTLPANSASSAYTNLTSGSQNTGSVDSQAPQEMSPADSAVSAIGSVVQLFQQVSSAFPNADEGKKQAVLQSLTDYMQSVAGSLNSGVSANSGGLGSPAESGGY